MRFLIICFILMRLIGMYYLNQNLKQLLIIYKFLVFKLKTNYQLSNIGSRIQEFINRIIFQSRMVSTFLFTRIILIFGSKIKQGSFKQISHSISHVGIKEY